MHNTFLVIVNEKVNQSRGATCYSSGFSYHLCQLVHIQNINEAFNMGVPWVKQVTTINITSNVDNYLKKPVQLVLDMI